MDRNNKTVAKHRTSTNTSKNLQDIKNKNIKETWSQKLCHKSNGKKDVDEKRALDHRSSNEKDINTSCFL